MLVFSELPESGWQIPQQHRTGTFTWTQRTLRVEKELHDFAHPEERLNQLGCTRSRTMTFHLLVLG